MQAVKQALIASRPALGHYSPCWEPVLRRRPDNLHMESGGDVRYGAFHSVCPP